MNDSAPGWYADPTARFELRYHNGQAWTADVATDGARYVDPLGTRPGDVRPVATGGRNTPATAAMTLGILAVATGWMPLVVVLSVVAAVLAIVLGVVGRRRARRTGIGAGRALTGLITGSAALAVSVVGVLFTISMFAAIDRFRNPVPNETVITGCERTADEVTASGELTNRSDRRSSFSVRVFYVRPGTDNVRRTALVEVDDVGAGDTVAFEVVRALGPDPVDCIVGAVRGPLPYGVDPGS